MSAEQLLAERGYEYVYDETKSVKMKKLVGKGASSAVYQVRRKADGLVIVCKELNFSDLSEREQECATNEIDLLSTLNHPSIIRIFDRFKITGGLAGAGEKHFVLLEYAEAGDVGREIRKRAPREGKPNGVPFPPAMIRKWFAQACLAVHYLHQRRIVHRDLKPDNLFLSNGNVKLGDLGVAKHFPPGKHTTTTHCGTPLYLSPEILNGVPYNAKTDVWSLGSAVAEGGLWWIVGVILYELVMLRSPFEGVGLAEVTKKIVTGDFKKVPINLLGGDRRGADDCTADVIQVITACLQQDPTKRPSVGALLNMPYLSGVVGRKDEVPRPMRLQMSPMAVKSLTDMGAAEEGETAVAASDDESYSDDAMSSTSGDGTTASEA